MRKFQGFFKNFCDHCKDTFKKEEMTGQVEMKEEEGSSKNSKLEISIRR